MVLVFPEFSVFSEISEIHEDQEKIIDLSQGIFQTSIQHDLVRSSARVMPGRVGSASRCAKSWVFMRAAIVRRLTCIKLPAGEFRRSARIISA
ncbi:hypothetical protein [Rhodoferax sp.]|uniref:hypothetical protein n=1 Tax=Rhodoferax sp. TaxID=50421 RepID=UPI0025E344BA|nr:hypothetical protein [Rhodoferax sp.]